MSIVFLLFLKKFFQIAEILTKKSARIVLSRKYMSHRKRPVVLFWAQKGIAMRPKKLTMKNGRRSLSDYGSRADEYREYNRLRWKYDREVKAFYNSKIWKETSRLVLLENDYICEYCGAEATMTDHVIPLKRDWNRRLDRKNLKASCKRCNDAKAIRERVNLS
jgi:hypothetical protein